MKTDSKDLRVREGYEIDLKKRPTIVGPMYKSKARARCHLRFIEIGRHIDVAHRNEIQKCGLFYKLVEEKDVILDAEFTRAGRQAVAIE